jgi:hypothetical protein
MLAPREFLPDRPERLNCFAGCAEVFAVRPGGGPMDAFSEILTGVKLNGALFFNADFSAPWGFASPAGRLR